MDNLILALAALILVVIYKLMRRDLDSLDEKDARKRGEATTPKKRKRKRGER